VTGGQVSSPARQLAPGLGLMAPPQTMVFPFISRAVAWPLCGKQLLGRNRMLCYLSCFVGSVSRLRDEKEGSDVASNQLAWNIPGREQEGRIFYSNRP
jgi:hypothetical protein